MLEKGHSIIYCKNSYLALVCCCCAVLVTVVFNVVVVVALVDAAVAVVSLFQAALIFSYICAFAEACSGRDV